MAIPSGIYVESGDIDFNKERAAEQVSREAKVGACVRSRKGSMHSSHVTYSCFLTHFPLKCLTLDVDYRLSLVLV